MTSAAFKTAIFIGDERLPLGNCAGAEVRYCPECYDAEPAVHEAFWALSGEAVCVACGDRMYANARRREADEARGQ